MHLIGCPECDATAELTVEGTAASTDGPLEIVRVVCVNRHWFLMNRDALRLEAGGPTAT
jgi:hypothetical protein